MLGLSGEIPALAHVAWKNRALLAEDSPAGAFPTVLNGVANLARLNPGWTVEVSDDADVDGYLQDRIPEDDYARIADRHIVEKVDLWRLVKIYSEGGLYIDVDRSINVPLSSVIPRGVRCVLPTHLDINFSQDLMLSVPGNEIFEVAIDLNLRRRRDGERNIYALGPDTYLDAVCTCILGAPLDRNDRLGTLERIRAVIDREPMLATYREGTDGETLLWRHDGESWQSGNGRGVDQFYAAEGVRHWAGRHD